jgi:hypothetical protein
MEYGRDGIDLRACLTRRDGFALLLWIELAQGYYLGLLMPRILVSMAPVNAIQSASREVDRW